LLDKLILISPGEGAFRFLLLLNQLFFEGNLTNVGLNNRLRHFLFLAPTTSAKDSLFIAANAPLGVDLPTLNLG
jgi:hypothetical protein